MTVTALRSAHDKKGAHSTMRKKSGAMAERNYGWLVKNE